MNPIEFLILPLALNAFVSFCIFFYFQFKAIFEINRASGNSNADLFKLKQRNTAEIQANFGLFLLGKLNPELRRKWLRALVYVFLSFLAVFLLALIRPE